MNVVERARIGGWAARQILNQVRIHRVRLIFGFARLAGQRVEVRMTMVGRTYRCIVRSNETCIEFIHASSRRARAVATFEWIETTWHRLKFVQ